MEASVNSLLDELYFHNCHYLHHNYDVASLQKEVSIIEFSNLQDLPVRTVITMYSSYGVDSIHAKHVTTLH